jgi:hypothetical protein
MIGLRKKIVWYGIFNSLVWAGISSYFSICLIYSGLLTKIIEEKGEKDVGPFQFTIVYTVAILLTIVYRSMNMRIKTQCLIFSSFMGVAYFLNFVLLHADHSLTYVLSIMAGVIAGIPYSLGIIVYGQYLAILCEG